MIYNVNIKGDPIGRRTAAIQNDGVIPCPIPLNILLLSRSKGSIPEKAQYRRYAGSPAGYLAAPLSNITPSNLRFQLDTNSFTLVCNI